MTTEREFLAALMGTSTPSGEQVVSETRLTPVATEAAALSLEVASNQAVTAEEVTSYTLTVTEAQALVEWRDYQEVGGPEPIQSDADRAWLQSMGLLD